MQASAATAVKDFRDDARARFLRIDPLMLVATVGLIAASIYIVGSATHDDIARATPTTSSTGRPRTRPSGSC